MALELDGLRRAFNGQLALDGLSLAAPRGEIVGFVGPNGAGKTTAMRIALGLLEPDAGEVRWQGRAVDASARRTFGYMPEERGLYPKMTVRRQLRYLATLHGKSSEEADRTARLWIDRLGLGDRADDKIEALSLGNQQRVQLAAALVHDPVALVLDEPFSGLDPIGVDVMSEVLVERASKGAAVIFSSHQLELVERLCRRVVIVADGRAVADGEVDELRRERSGRRYVVEVDAADSSWIDGVRGAQVVGHDGAALHVELQEETDEQAVLYAGQIAGPLRQFYPLRPTLAELFRDVVPVAGDSDAAAAPVAKD